MSWDSDDYNHQPFSKVANIAGSYVSNQAKRFGKSVRSRITKTMMKQLGKLAFKSFVVKTAPIWGSLLLIFFLGYIAMMIVFGIPKMAAEDASATMKDKVSAFFGGVVDDEAFTEQQNIFEEYREVAQEWDMGLTEDQKSQVIPYAFSWGVLAGVDRMVNDPFYNSGAKGGSVSPQPEQTFEALKPRFEWKSSTITREWSEQVCEEVKTPHDGVKSTTTSENENVIEECKDVRKKETETVSLLSKVHTYAGIYTYHYDIKMIDDHGVSVTEEVVSKIDVPTDDEYLSPLLAYLDSRGISNELDIETTMQIIATYDSMFEVATGYQEQMIDRGSPNFVYPSDLKEGAFINPVPTGYTTSLFGYRWGGSDFHPGIDIGTNGRPEPVYAAADGYVVRSYTSKSYGNCIMIALEIDGVLYTTVYAHNTVLYVEEEQEVKQGDLIAKTGNTGYSEGIHLHFELHKGEWNVGKTNARDPKNFIKF